MLRTLVGGICGGIVGLGAAITIQWMFGLPNTLLAFLVGAAIGFACTSAGIWVAHRV